MSLNKKCMWKKVHLLHEGKKRIFLVASKRREIYLGKSKQKLLVLMGGVEICTSLEEKTLTRNVYLREENILSK